MRKRKRQEHPENIERWLVSYADMLTVLLIFFVVLYAMSQIDTAKFERLRLSLAEQFSSPFLINLGQPGPAAGEDVLDPTFDDLENPLTKNPEGDPVTDTSPSQTGEAMSGGQEIEALYSQLQSFIQKNQLQNQISLINKPEGISLSFQEVLLFDTGKAEMKPEGQAHLKSIVEMIKRVPNAVSIEGHTDKRPIHTKEFPSNWELSTARALTVLHFMVDQGVDPARLHVVGYGEYKPLSKDNLQRNRRVDLVILRDQPANATGNQEAGKDKRGQKE